MNKVENIPSVSIVMPVYNAIEFLKDSTNDVLSQTYQDLELICVNDGSTDGSGEFLDELSKKDSRVKVIHQLNSGGGAARNRGLNEARGKYLLFLDSDDRFEPDLLEKAVKRVKETSADIVAYGGDVFDYKTGAHSQVSWLIKSDMEPTLEDPLSVINTSVWNKIYLREFIINNEIVFQENRIVDTACFVFCAVVYARRITTINDVLIHYRTNNENSIISNSDKYPVEAYRAFAAIKEKMDADGIFDSKRLIFANYFAEYIFSRLHLMKTGYGFESLYNAIHDGGLKNLDIEDLVLEGKIKNKEYEKTLQRIRNVSATEFLFDRDNKLKELGMFRSETYILPLPVQDKKTKVVVYGGGNVGKDYFSQAMKRADIELAFWVDRNYEKMGYPLASPEILVNSDYELVIIAISSKKLADTIMESLVQMGVPENKIFWEMPISF